MIEQQAYVCNYGPNKENAHPFLTEATPHDVVLHKDETQLPTTYGKVLTRICLILALTSAISLVTWRRIRKAFSEVDFLESNEVEHLFLHGFQRGTDNFIKYDNNTPPHHSNLGQPLRKDEWSSSGTITPVVLTIKERSKPPPLIDRNTNTREYDSSQLPHLRLRARRQLNLAQYFYLFDPKTVVSKHERWDRQHQYTFQQEYLRDEHKVKPLSDQSSEIGGERQQQLSTVKGEKNQPKQPMAHQQPSPKVASSSPIILADSMGTDKAQNNEGQMQQEVKPAGKQIGSAHAQNSQLNIVPQLGITKSWSESNAPLHLGLPTPNEDQSLQEAEETSRNSRNQNIQLKPEEALNSKKAPLSLKHDDTHSLTIPQNDTLSTEKLGNKIARLPMPPSFRYLADFPSELESGDIPVFWHIPRSGGSTIKDILAGCLQIRVADEVGTQFGHEHDERLQVFEKHGAKFVNVDTTTLDGIAKAKRLNITSSGIVDAIVVSYIYEASELFLPGHRGKFFTMIRDPIERHMSLKGYLGDASWEEKTYDPAFANMSMEEFAYDRRVKNNWMTRWLSNQRTGDLSEHHLVLAKEVLSSKFVVGLLPEMERSMQHFEKYFGWQIINRPHRKTCVEGLVAHGANRHQSTKDIKVTDPKGYEALLSQNVLDMELYHYAEQIFLKQSEFFDNIPRPLVGTLE